MSTFTWHDNSNLDYGGIAFREIDWAIRQIARVAVPGTSANDNTVLWHRQRKRDDAEAMSLFRALDDTVTMDTDD
jgi:hypothetical protein